MICGCYLQPSFQISFPLFQANGGDDLLREYAHIVPSESTCENTVNQLFFLFSGLDEKSMYRILQAWHRSGRGGRHR